MKSAVFALLFSSVYAQPEPGTEAWDRTLREHREAVEVMAEKGFNMVVDLNPKACTKSKQCGMPYREGGCCFRVKVSRNSDGEVKDYQNDILKLQGEDGGLCYIGTGVDVIEQNGGRIDSYNYSKYMWDNTPYLRATWSAYFEQEMFDSFDAFNAHLEKVMPDQIARKDQYVEGECIDHKLHPYDMDVLCNSAADCNDAWGHFNGGCCGRMELTKGADNADPETIKFLELQGEGGICTPKISVDYIMERGDVNTMEFQRWSFENNFAAKAQYVWWLPEEQQMTISFDELVDMMRKEYPAIDNQKDMWFQGQCLGDRVPGEPTDWEAVTQKYFGDDEDRMDGPITWEMKDGMTHIKGEGFEIMMSEGEDGNRMSIIMEGAARLTLTASALTFAALTLY